VKGQYWAIGKCGTSASRMPALGGRADVKRSVLEVLLSQVDMARSKFAVQQATVNRCDVVSFKAKCSVPSPTNKAAQGPVGCFMKVEPEIACNGSIAGLDRWAPAPS
jgi:hypothetical protein